MNLTNHFLIAMPSLADPNFYQTVTYICAHDAEGAMGIVINRPMPFGLGAILSQMDLESSDARINDMPIFQGGPVQQERGFIIHRPVKDWESTIKVTEEIGVGTSRDILAAISEGTGPPQTLIALGYAGWGAGQLEREMAENAWLSGPADMNVMFEAPAELRWQKSVTLLGVDPRQLSSYVGHA
ncbi:MAG: YqgE/AlgH family protein [Gammaproteobacteria bacterium]